MLVYQVAIYGYSRSVGIESYFYAAVHAFVLYLDRFSRFQSDGTHTPVTRAIPSSSSWCGIRS